MFDLKAFYFNLIESFLLLSIISKNYFKRILYIYISFYLVIKSLSYLRFFKLCI